MSGILEFLAVEERIRAKAAYAECVVRKDHNGVRFELCVRDDLRDEPFIVLSRTEGDRRWRIEWHDGDAELEIGYDDLAGFLRDVSENGIDAALDRIAAVASRSSPTTSAGDARGRCAVSRGHCEALA